MQPMIGRLQQSFVSGFCGTNMTAGNVKTAAFDLTDRMRKAVLDDSDPQDIVREFSRTLGYDYFGYAICQICSESSLSFAVDGFPPGWWDHFVAQSYGRHSPVSEWVGRTSLPIYWNVAEHAGTSSGIVQRMCVEALDSGIGDIYVVPAHGQKGERYAFNLARSTPGEPMGPSHEHFPSVTLFATYMHVHSIERLSCSQPLQDLPKLTDAEKECLFWLLQGKVAAEIAIITSRQRSTTAFHLNNAKQKLDASSWAHAAHLAMRMGLI